MIIRDTREQKNKGWHFDDEVIKKLDTGDYSIEGLEDYFCIERKGKVTEFARNLVEPRFENALARLNDIDHPFIVLEFSEKDLRRYPEGLRLPQKTLAKIKLRGKFLMKRLNEIIERYPNIEIVFAGEDGKLIANNLMKRFEGYENI